MELRKDQPSFLEALAHSYWRCQRVAPEFDALESGELPRQLLLPPYFYAPHPLSHLADDYVAK